MIVRRVMKSFEVCKLITGLTARRNLSNFYFNRCYSSKITVKLPDHLSQVKLGQASHVKKFRCDQPDPVDHRLTDIGLFYTIPQNHTQKMVNKGLEIDFLSQQYIRHCKAFNEYCMMIRKPNLELVHFLKTANYNLPVNRYLLYGSTGTGKSMALLYALHYAMCKDWLIVPTTNLWNWTKFKSKVVKENRLEVAPSQWKEGRYDQPEHAATWLKVFKTLNSSHLSNLYTTKHYQWSKRDETAEGKTFLELVDAGINRNRYASDVIGAIIREITKQESQQFPKTLVVADNVNVLFEKPIQLKLMYGVIPEANQLTFFYHFRKLLSGKWKNGAVVTALSTTSPSKLLDMEEYPYDILTSEGFDCLDPHIPIEVVGYSNKEALSQLAYYIDKKWINGKSLTEAGEAELLQVSDLNPRCLTQRCAYSP